MKQVNCIFCDTLLAGQKSREHIIPQWLLDHLDIREDQVTPTHMKPDGEIVTQRRHDLNNFVAGRVCDTCNNGWMSRLEATAKPLLIKLASGERAVVELDARERFVVARWAAKTAYVLNFASNYHDVVPASHFRVLREHDDQLPPSVCVFGQQHHEQQKFYWLQGAPWDFRIQGRKPSTAELENLTQVALQNSYKVVLQFGKLLLLVAYWPLEGWNYALWRGIHVPLWPQRGPIAWYDDEGFPWHDSIEAIAAFGASLRVVTSFKDEPNPQVLKNRKPGRNEPCSCGSGLKYKKCCGG